MESYGLPQGGFQLPVQRRLSRLYTDTKKSSDFVKQPIQNAEDPDVKSLHRKLKIQNDRLYTWGLGWSDPGNADIIDDALSKAGVSEVVGSIMSNIKDILAEAQPLWDSSRYRADPSRPLGDKKLPPWNPAKLEDLIRELTTCIDTLYDLSRTRSNAALSSQARARLYKSGSTEEMRAFESTRMQTPQKIDPQTLTSLRERQPVPMSEAATSTSARDIVFMSKQAYSHLTGNNGRPYTALLVEYAEFDPMYSQVDILPDMSRFEKLSAGLQTEPQRSPGSWTGLPQLLGYFEQMNHSRLGLVYHFPPSFHPVSYEPVTHNTLINLCSLADLLARPDFEPPLEAKFRLAFNLANTVFDMHARGIIHGNLVNSNVSFCRSIGAEPTLGSAEVDIRRPLVSSFDLFSESFEEGGDSSSPPTVSLWRHPLDPRVTSQRSLLSNGDSKAFDCYSLAMLLLSIGLWTPLETLVASPAATSVPESVLEQLAIRCGTLYMKAVQICWTAVDEELRPGADSSQIMTQVQVKASRFLEACAIIDSVGGLEDRLSSDLGIQQPPSSRMGAKQEGPVAGSSKDSKAREAGFTVSTPEQPPRSTMPQAAEVQTVTAVAPVSVEPRAKRSKCRLYPHTALPPEAVEHWNTVLMPQINQALRHFYRKNPESVEISLESIGDSSRDTKPTVLVVCTSVAKVKAILRRKVGALFDDTTGYGLKVCRGKVLRSRLEGSAADHPDVTATANRAYQERPSNGASIGAWVGDRHLPPVSFGGLVVVDDQTYGMTVHHMLDDPDADPDATPAPPGHSVVERSGAGAGKRQSGDVTDIAAWYAAQYPDDPSPSSGDSSDSEDFAAEFSDVESEDASAITSQYEDSHADYDEQEEEEEAQDDSKDFGEPGDIPGIEPGCGDGYIISQPALDDVEEGFFPSPETQDEDHLDSFSLGEVFASSGIRRRDDAHGLTHEIDWALFKFQPDRLPAPTAAMPRAVLPSAALPNREVQCTARTSGLQTGRILPALTSVKIYGRATPSHTYQVTTTTTTATTRNNKNEASSSSSLGLPGDSGAWIVERGAQGRVCGHVLAFSQRKKVAYICPMEVLLLDIAEALDAAEVRLPGGLPVVKPRDEGYHEEEDEYDEEEECEGTQEDMLRSRATVRSLRKGKGKPVVQRAATMRVRPVEDATVLAGRPKSFMDDFGEEIGWK